MEPSAPTSPDRLQFNKLEYQQWLREPTTIRVISQLRLLSRNHLEQAMLCGANPGAGEVILRACLTKASTLQQVINRLEVGELDATKLIV